MHDDDIGVVAALPAEAASWWHAPRRIRPGQPQRAGRWSVLACGVGAQRAAQATKQLLDQGVSALVSWGVAGGLDPVLCPGDVLLPVAVVSGDVCTDVDHDWHQSLSAALSASQISLSRQPLWCASQPVISAVEKRRLAQTCGCGSVDMESATVAALAAEAGVPFAAIKAVCDPATQSVPAVAWHLLTPAGHLRPLGMCVALLQGPRVWRALQRLRADHAAACASLRQVAQALEGA